MACDAIRPMIRPFLDDLLDEKDYQGIHAHIEACEHCRVYASSVGTLSYRLYELGQAPIPPDMVSTILYESKKQSVQPPQSQPAVAEEAFSFSKNYFFGITVSLLIVLSTALLAGITALRKAPPVAASRVVVANVSADNAPLEQKPKEWHYHFMMSRQQELLELVRRMGFEIKHESNSGLIFSVPNAKLGEFKDQITGFSGVVKEFGESDPSVATGDSTLVSIYLE